MSCYQCVTPVYVCNLRQKLPFLAAALQPPPFLKPRITRRCSRRWRAIQVALDGGAALRRSRESLRGIFWGRVEGLGGRYGRRDLYGEAKIAGGLSAIGALKEWIIAPGVSIRSSRLLHFEVNFASRNGLCQKLSFPEVLHDLIDLSGSFWREISLTTDVTDQSWYVFDRQNASLDSGNILRDATAQSALTAVADVGDQLYFLVNRGH